MTAVIYRLTPVPPATKTDLLQDLIEHALDDRNDQQATSQSRIAGRAALRLMGFVKRAGGDGHWHMTLVDPQGKVATIKQDSFRDITEAIATIGELRGDKET